MRSLLVALFLASLFGCNRGASDEPKAVCQAWLDGLHAVVRAGTSAEVKAMVLEDCTARATVRQAQRADRYGCWTGCMKGEDGTADECDEKCQISGLPDQEREAPGDEAPAEDEDEIEVE